MKRPNILIFMTDQQRADSILNPNCFTPNLDKFREQSITFTNAFCPSPHCCPSRATFMSGLFPSQHGVWHNVNVPNAISRSLNDGVKLWSEYLAETGYDMSFSGKWHISATEGPESRGWNVFPKDCNYTGHLSATEGWEMYRSSFTLSGKNGSKRDRGEIIRHGWQKYIHYGETENPFNDQDVVDTALDIIKSRKKREEPWCQFVGTLGPHDPYFVPKQFLDMYPLENIKLPDNFDDKCLDKPNLYQRTRKFFAQLPPEEHREAIQHYLAFCSYEDYLFGQIIDELENSDQLDNTLIIYLSDHGDYAGEHGLWCKGLPCFKSAYHIPCIVGGKALKSDTPRLIEQYVSLADFAPTFLDLAGIKYAENDFYGKSLMPFLKGADSVENWRKHVYTQSNGNEQYGIQRSYMTEKWKFVHNGFDFDELYNLESDPLEVNNLINDEKYKEIVIELCNKLWQEGYKVKDHCVDSYIMIGMAPVGPGVVFNN